MRRCPSPPPTRAGARCKRPLSLHRQKRHDIARVREKRPETAPDDVAIVGHDLPAAEGTSIREELKRRGIAWCSIIDASAYLSRTTFESRGSSCAGEPLALQTAPSK